MKFIADLWKRRQLALDMKKAEAFMLSETVIASLTRRESLRGAALRGIDLRGASLSGAKLSYASLQGAHLQRTNLSQANLSRADLIHADLREANLTEANLVNTLLCGADLSGADLLWADLRGADLNGATLRGANLREATINEKTKFTEGFNPVEAGMTEQIYEAYHFEEESSIQRPARSIPLKVRDQVFRNANRQCQQCGKSASDGVKLEIDHIMPVSRGGSDDISNLQLLCFDCNRGKSDRID